MCKINGKKLADIRTKNGISQAQFAKKVGISVGSVRNYEGGKTKDVNSKTVRLMAMVLNVTPEELDMEQDLGRDVMAGRRESAHHKFNSENRYMTPFHTQCLIIDMRNGNDSICEDEAKRALERTQQITVGDKKYAVVKTISVNIPKWQRDTDREKCHEIAENYNENKYDPIKVYIYNGKMYVADGAHRLVAYLMQEKEWILVELMSCENEKEAAVTFLTQSFGVRRMSQNDMWRAAIEANLVQYTTLRSLCMECKIQIKADLYKIDNPVGTLNTVSGTILKMAVKDPVLLKRIFEMIKRLNWNASDASPYKTYILSTLKNLYATYNGREDELENLLMITCKGATYYEEKVCTTLTQCRLYDMISEDLEKTNALLKKTVTE